jgi:hypothetical protein
MSSISYKFGEQIEIAVQEPGGATDKVIKTTLYNANGFTVIAGPITLTHQSNGLYTDSSLNMTAAEKQIMQHQIFETDGVTPNLTGDLYLTQMIDLADENQGTTIVEQVETIVDIPQDETMLAYTEQDESVTAYVEEDSDDIEVFAEADNNVIVEVEPDPDIVVYVEEC